MIPAPVIGLLYAAAVSFKTLLQKIQDLEKIYELDLTSADSHRLVES